MTTSQGERMRKHVVVSAADAVRDVFDGAMVCVGGFGPIRNRPIDLLIALADQQIARNLTDAEDGFLRGVHYLILDRDPLYTVAFRDRLEDSGVTPLRLPAGVRI